MDFSEALTLLKHGQRVRRLAWPGGAAKWVEIQAGELVLRVDDVWRPCQFLGSDIMAADWVEVKESEPLTAAES